MSDILVNTVLTSKEELLKSIWMAGYRRTAEMSSDMIVDVSIP
jgi:hypothetical protein